MKGKRTMKRILAVVMAVVFTVTGFTFTPKSAQATTWTGSGTKDTFVTHGDWDYYVKTASGAWGIFYFGGIRL